ncbi:MAG: hypothetical protein NTW20_18110 [Rhodobacterales bacterium]|nr:hypothetical protein [Rhodobacterales bacterium]
MPTESTGRDLPPLELRVSQKATLQIKAARQWLRGLDPTTERRFARRLDTLLIQLCEELPSKIATGRPPQLDEKASIGLLRPAFQERFYTSEKKPPPRSNASTWRVFYGLLDTDGDNQPEALEVLRVYHAAAELPWDRIEALETNQNEDNSPQETG